MLCEHCFHLCFLHVPAKRVRATTYMWPFFYLGVSKIRQGGGVSKNIKLDIVLTKLRCVLETVSLARRCKVAPLLGWWGVGGVTRFCNGYPKSLDTLCDIM